MLRLGMFGSLLVMSLSAGAVRVDGAGQTTATAGQSDEQAIKAVIAATTDAFSRHDAKAWFDSARRMRSW
jgi:hypothetical protein